MSKTLGLSIRHYTGFNYAGHAKLSYNEARVTPRSTASQMVTSSRIALQPIVPIATHVDYFGTVVTSFDIQELHPRLEVESVCVVDSWAGRREPAVNWEVMRHPSMRDQFAEYLISTSRTILDSDPEFLFEEWALINDLHECVDAISDFVRLKVGYKPGATTVSATAADAWRTRQGVCQDITHVTLGLLRMMGIPARYVSGYLYPDKDPQIGNQVVGESHAWVEYFSGEWTGIDPTNGIGETERHIIVGYGRDYDDVPPLKGIYQGSDASELGVIVEMTRTH